MVASTVPLAEACGVPTVAMGMWQNVSVTHQTQMGYHAVVGGTSWGSMFCGQLRFGVAFSHTALAVWAGLLGAKHINCPKPKGTS